LSQVIKELVVKKSSYQLQTRNQKLYK